METTTEAAALTHEAWLEERRKGIGGSDVAAIVGLNPYEGAMDVWMKKTGRAGETPDNENMRRGRLLEPVIGTLYSERTGRTLLPGEFRVDPDNPIFLGTADFLVEGEKRGMEAKAPRSRQWRRWGPEGSGHFPEEYLCQCSWYLGVFRYEFWDLVPWLGAEELRVYEIPYNAAVIEGLRERAERFWTDCVLADLPPAVDSSVAWSMYLADMFPQGTDEWIEATEEAWGLAKDLRKVLLDKEEIEARETFLENRIKALIGTSAGVFGQGWKIPWGNRAGRKTTKWEQVVKTIAREFKIPDERVDALILENTEQGAPTRSLRTSDLKKCDALE